MSRKLIIDPITRVSGFLEIEAEIEKHRVISASTSGLLYRGFEKILRERAPLDAVYLTQRICGICSAAHSIASSTAIEDALGIEIKLNDSYIRDIIHGFEFIQNHIRHFYLFTISSYVRLPDINPIHEDEYFDFRIPKIKEEVTSKNYITSIEMGRLAHEGQSVFGGKAPHNHGIFPGGVNTAIDSYKLSKVKSIINKLDSFISLNMTEDMNVIGEYYKDYFNKGGSYLNFMSFGLFDNYANSDITYLKSGVIIEGTRDKLLKDNIEEDIVYSYYKDEEDNININKKDGYTFIKAARYLGLPMEVGPLARLILSGEYKYKSSTMDRINARVIESKKIIRIMAKIIDRINIGINNQNIYNFTGKYEGYGLIDTTRGALYHKINIEKGKISDYKIITPTSWNLSPKDRKGVYGTGEKALIGTKVEDDNNGVEIGRIIRSFDPCVSCATHVYKTRNKI